MKQDLFHPVFRFCLIELVEENEKLSINQRSGWVRHFGQAM